jgi:Phage tail tube protein, TTP
MAGIFATAGSKVFIGSSLSAKSADFGVGDFSAQSWVEISWLESVGAFGDEAATITFNAIGEGRTQKLKGTRNAGDMQLVCGVDYGDAGQAALKAAEATPLNYAFKVQFNDMPSGGTSPSLRYFIGIVLSARETLDTANNVIKMTAAIGINSNIVRVAAT